MAAQDAMMRVISWPYQQGALTKVTKVERSLGQQGGTSGRYHPEFVGICGTDLDIMAGSRSDKARVLGHEAVIRSEPPPADSPARSRANVYVVNPVNPQNQDDIVGHSTPGMLRSLVEIPDHWVSAGRLVPVGEGIPLHLATLAEPVGVALYALELLSAMKDSSRQILIVGAGPIGAAISLSARLVTDSRVAVVDVSPSRISRVLDLGMAHEGIVASTPDALGIAVSDCVPDAVAICVPRPVRLTVLDVVCKCAPSDSTIDLVTGYEVADALEMLPGVSPNHLRRMNVCGAPRGGAVLALVTRQGRPLRLTGHRGTSRAHIEQALVLLQRYPEEFGKLITDIVGPDELPELLTRLLSEREMPETAPYRKVVVDMRHQAPPQPPG